MGTTQKGDDGLESRVFGYFGVPVVLQTDNG